MSVKPPVKRRYDPSKRREAAARTREAILNSALRLFDERGYAATPMTAIAEQGGVALDTVYASIGRKTELARLLIETAISGSSQAVPAGDRGYVQAIRAAPDAETKIAIYASAMRTIAGRLAPVLGILQQAAPAEPELAALWREIAERQAANMRLFVTDLAAVSTLRMDPGEAADIVWATNARPRALPAARLPARLDPGALRAFPRRNVATPAPSTTTVGCDVMRRGCVI
jgi:AcrR family transcriptional regulator